MGGEEKRDMAGWRPAAQRGCLKGDQPKPDHLEEALED
jgi:hypothetical protein